MSVTTPAEDLLDPRLTDVAVTRSSLREALASLDPATLLLALGLPSGDSTALEARLDEAGLDGADLVATHEPNPDAASLTTIPLRPAHGCARRVVVAGLGGAGRDELREAAAALGRASRGHEHLVAVLGELSSEDRLAAFVEGFLLGGWGPPRWTGQGVRAGAQVCRRLTIVLPADAGADLADAAGRAAARAKAVVRARSLGVTPSNVKNPGWMAERARILGRRTGLEVTVRTQRDLLRQGFGGLLAVGGGSATPPRLVQLDWTPPGAGPDSPRAVLVGKGITFDTGGLQIKSRENMLAMKTDMLGSAIVLGVLSTCRELGIGVRVTGLMALAENAVGGGSYRPGDVITQYGGTTVEIGNTDAEGRIVLADALAYADAALEPDWLVDVATLTGAARVALARVMAPVYANDEGLGAALVAAGETTGETLWPMPLARGYRQALDSDVADLKHIAPSVGGGSITAGLFLQEFVGARRWAHLDIAGPGRSDVDAGILGKGATAFGTRLLLRWLEGLA